MTPPLPAMPAPNGFRPNSEFTRDQLRAYRIAMIEWAAKVVRDGEFCRYVGHSSRCDCVEIASAIRAATLPGEE
jgi:hypothetical protein